MKKKVIFFYRAGYVLAAFALVSYWLIAIKAYQDGELFAYETFYNLSMSTSGLFILLIFFTVAWFWTIPKYWNGPQEKDDEFDL